ncbi:MAG TPA: YkvA family protein [Coleofasciculaceae cyanobacterium]
MQTWKQRVRQLKKEQLAIYIACKDPRVPWYARVFAGFVVAYALSPIDLIPDVIPILGYLDDLILVPLGIILVLKMIPPAVLAECREKAEAAMNQDKPTSWIAAIVIVAIWLLLGILGLVWIGRILKR